MKKTIFLGIILSLLTLSASSVFANSISINYRCSVNSAVNETAIYTTIVFAETMKNSSLKIGNLNKLGYSVDVTTEALDSDRGQLLFNIKEPNGGRTTLLTSTSSYFSFNRAPISIECSKF